MKYSLMVKVLLTINVTIFRDLPEIFSDAAKVEIKGSQCFPSELMIILGKHILNLLYNKK